MAIPMAMVMRTTGAMGMVLVVMAVVRSRGVCVVMTVRMIMGI